MKVSELVNLYGSNAVAALPYDRITPDSNVFFVDSSNSLALDSVNDRTGSRWDAPFATLNYAVSRCTASKGDVILIGPGHTETIEDTGSASGTTTDELVFDKIGISVIGIGNGTLKPTFSLETAVDAALVILAANTYIENIKVVSGLANVTAGITIGASADGTHIHNCEIRDGNAAALELVIGISVAANADDIKITNNVFSTVPSGGCASAITLAGGCDRMQVVGNVAYGTYSAGVMAAAVAASAEAVITDNIFVNEGALALGLHASGTGILARNYLGGTTSIAAALTGETLMWCFENYVTGAAAASAIIDPAVDAD